MPENFSKRFERGLYLLVEMPMLILDALTVRARDRMPRSIKEIFPYLNCREHSPYFEPRVRCKVADRYQHRSLMTLLCRHYQKNGACGRYSNRNSHKT